ncbi:hypothetical protein LCGC14_1261810, partial [marine sediment metagenome]
MNVRKTRKRRITSLFILFTFLVGVITNPLLFFPFGRAVVQEQDLSVDWGDNVFQNLPYTFSGTFYENSDPTFAFSNADIEYTYIPDPTINNEYTITGDFTNNESRQPLNESFVSMTNGEYFNTTEMQVDDDIYAGYNYTGIGVYRATYSFTDELDGMSGTDIDFVDIDNSDVDCTVTIMTSLDGHKKVLELDDQSAVGKITIINALVNEEYGSIEFWILTTDATIRTDVGISHGPLPISRLRIDLDGFRTNDGGGGFAQIVAASDNTWYHVKIDFELTAGGYQGLAEDDYHIHIDGIHYGDYDVESAEVHADRFTFSTNDGDNGYTTYIDAIGYSWDNDYMIGWNREEWAFFGDYPAAYSFEGDDIGDDPSGWVISEASSGDIEVVSGFNGHKKVVHFQDTNAASISTLTNTFSSYEESGAIEFWVTKTNSLNLYFRGYKDGGTKFINQITSIVGGDAFSYDIWHLIKLTFECDVGGYDGLAADTYNIYLDGILTSNSPFAFDTPVDSLNGLHFETHTPHDTVDIHFDAIDYSWSPGYSNGRNRLTENDDILGHYPASHSFPFDNIGEAPEGWDNAAYTVIGSAWQEHRKVLKLTRDGSNPIIERDFYTDITSGTIELYMGSDDVTQLSHLRLYDGASSVIQINLYDDKLQYRYDGAYNPILDPILDNKWYHIKLDFETGAGLYKGLAADTFYITIDGTQYGPYPFNNVAPHVDKIYFTCNSAAVYNYYVDAIDYSWDPYYYVGRNINPTTANLLGQYPGTYSFESELVYAKDNEIGFFSAGTADSATIIEEYYGHKKVMKWSSGIAGYMYNYDFKSNSQTTGTIELYAKTVVVAPQIRLREGGGSFAVVVKVYSGSIRAYYGDGAGGSTYQSVVVDSNFQHIKIKFDTITDRQSVWINGINLIDNVPFDYDARVDVLDSYSMYASAGFEFYLDAISYSWDDNYLIGDNLHYNNFLGSETFENYNQTYPGDYYGTESFDYYTEDEVYYGTYDFRDEADGTSGTSIDFVDFVNLYDGGVEIVSSWQSHNKVLRLQDDATAGEDPHFHHNIVQTTSGTHEFWIGTNDVTKYWEFYTFEGGIGYINRLRISASSISYFDGGAWNVLIAVSNNIFYHVQLVWRADNTQDIYINGVLEADNVSTDDNMVSGVNRIFFKCFGDSTDYLYLDAYGETEDTTSHGGLGYTVDYNILSQDIEPILEGGYEIDNI